MCKFKPCNLCRPFLVSRGNLIKHKKDALGSISLSVSLSWWRVYTHTHYTQLHKFLMETTTTTARIRRKMNTFKINRLKSKLRTVRTHVWPGRAANRTESWKCNQSHRLSKRIRKCNQVWATWWMFIFFFFPSFLKQIYGWSLKSPRGQKSSSRCHEGNLLENEKVLLATGITASKRKEV